MTEIGIYYKRGSSKMLLKYEYINEAYERFKGNTIATTDLKQFKPNIFDSSKNGHGCHCTMFFLLLEEFGMLKDGIQGKGVAGSPFYVTIK